MSGYVPKVGDSVSATVEGVVTHVEGGPGGLVRVGGDTGFGWVEPHVLERLPDPEPEWWPPQPGDVIQCAETTYFVTNTGPLHQGTLDYNNAPIALDEWMGWVLQWRADVPAAHFALLVRDGKSVQP